MANIIQGLPSTTLGAGAAVGTAGGGKPADFLQTLRGAIDQVQQLHVDAQGQVAGMLDGTGDDVHSAMIAVEKADLAFEMMVQVRNKIVQAYQTISQMQF